MNSQYVTLIQSSFAKLEPHSEQVAELFYARVFELNPEFRRLFPDDMKQQKVKLISMLSFVVDSLLVLEALIPTLQQLGVRHRGYGVHAEDYQPLGAALIWTLDQVLGDEFTPDVRRAWTSTYAMMANTMVQAAESE